MAKSNILIWLDDIRNPKEYVKDHDGDIIWIESYDLFVKWIEKHGLPNMISFDHDLADQHYAPADVWNDPEKYLAWEAQQNFTEKTGYDCAKWLVDYCVANGVNLPEYRVHSANPIGAENIYTYLTNATKHLGI